MGSMKEHNHHPIITDKLIYDFNIQSHAGHYFVIGKSIHETTTQKNVVLEQQKRKLNLAGESRRRSQGKDDDEDLVDQELEINGSIITVKIEPMTRDMVDIYKQIIKNGEVILPSGVELPELINDFTLSDIPLISRVYLYQKTPIDFSKRLIVKINNSFRKKLDKEISSHVKKSK